MNESIVQQIPLFASLPPAEIERLAKTLRAVEFPAQVTLLREGEYGDRFYILLAGQVEIIKALDSPDQRLLGVRGPGEYIGEMSLLNADGKRTASVRTSSQVKALEMSRADFDELLHRQPSIAYDMTRVLSERLNEAHNATIRDLQGKNRQLLRAYEELQAAQSQIVEKEKLEHELQLARQIQESILPRTMPRVTGFDFGARMIPSRAVGGDFFDFVPLDDAHLGIAIADVSDKGVPAAIFMALTRSLLRAEAKRTLSPRAVMRKINRLLLEMNAGEMFVTMLYGVLDTRSREFEYARAGHTLPLIFKARHKVLMLHGKSGQPLGIFADFALDVQQVVLARGDRLVIYTDGITEAMNDQGDEFGVTRLCDSVAARPALSPQALCAHVLADIAAFRGSSEQSDDIALVALRVK